jgi:hypothetical protein
MTIALVEGAFQGNGVSEKLYLYKKFNVSLTGTFTADVELQRSFDGGVTWLPVARFSQPTQGSGEEPETYVFYRLVCSNYGSGTATYRLSQ